MSLSLKDLKSIYAQEKKNDIPQDVVELLSNKTKATIRPMTVKEHRELLKAMEKRDEYLINQAFDSILDKCVVDIDGKGFNNDTLYVNDRIYLLLMIHKLTNGIESKITHICPVSNKPVSDIKVNLDECIKLRPYNGASLTETKDLSPSVRITLEPITRKVEKEMEKWLKGKDSVTEQRYAAYAGLIKKLEAKTKDGVYEEMDKFDDKISFIEMLNPSELSIFEKYAISHNFGVDVKFHFKSDVYENSEEEASIISFFIM